MEPNNSLCRGLEWCQLTLSDITVLYLPYRGLEWCQLALSDITVLYLPYRGLEWCQLALSGRAELHH